MKKIRFGTKEILALVLGVVLFAGIRILENYLYGQKIVPFELSSWISPGLLVIAATAVFFGPACGMLCGVGGDLIIRGLFGSSVRFLELFTLGLYGLLIGVYYGRLHYRHDSFGIRELIDFNVIQVLVGIICGIFVIPLGQFFLDGAGINEAVVNGTRRTIGASVMVGVILSPIMLAVGFAASKHKDYYT